VDNLNKKNIPLTQAVVTDKAKSIFEDLKKNRGWRGDTSTVNTACFLQKKNPHPGTPPEKQDFCITSRS